jgi:hypothetical protein
MASGRVMQRVVFREVKTFYSISEMLECGHRVENFGMVQADPLTAKHRNCPQCEKALPQKKPVASVRRGADGLGKVSGEVPSSS